MRLKTLLQEPLLHFLAIGAALFLLFQWTGGSGQASSRIVLSAGQVDHLAAGFARTWQRPPTDAELKGLVDDWVREEIAVREAMTSGLDRDDTIIRRRLRQKLEFVLEDADGTASPSDQELQAWLDGHTDRFRVEPRVSFRQVFVNPTRRGAAAEGDARRLLARLRSAGPDAPIARVGDPIMLPSEVERESRGDIARSFGEEFAGRVEAIAPGTWTGPIESSYGLHLVLVRERFAGFVPGLAEVRPAVEREVLIDRRAGRIAATYQRLLGKYTVVIEKPEADGAGGRKGKGEP
jgi:hypothetical protein